MTSSNTYFLLFLGGGEGGGGGVLTIKKRNQITLSNDKQQFETQQIESIVPRRHTKLSCYFHLKVPLTKSRLIAEPHEQLSSMHSYLGIYLHSHKQPEARVWV